MSTPKTAEMIRFRNLTMYFYSTLLLLSTSTVSGFHIHHNRSNSRQTCKRLNSPNDVTDVKHERNDSGSRPLVLVGFSGAGNELPRLANGVIEFTSGMTSAAISLWNIQLDENEELDEQNSLMSMDCGVLEPIGFDELGLWTYDTDIFDELILGEDAKLNQNDVILLDLGGDLFEQAFALSPESSKQLEGKYIELLKHLYKELNCLVVYVNVHPAASNMTPRSASAAISLHDKLVEYSNYELVIYDEGLSAATILARDAIGDNKGNGLPKREYGSFDTLQSELEKQSSNDTISNQVDAWKGVLWDIKRLILHTRSGQNNGKYENLKLFGRDTFFTSLTFGDIRDAKEYMPSLCPDADAMEFRSDLIHLEDILSREGLLDESTSEHRKGVKNIRTYEGRFHMMRQVGLLRRMCRSHSTRIGTLGGIMHDVMPVVFTVRTAHQAGTWPDSNDEEIDDMLYLLELGLRSGVEVLDVEGYWENESILNLAAEKYPETVVLGSHHVVGSTCTDEVATDHFEHCFLKGKADALKVVLSIEDSSNADQADRCGKAAVAKLIEKYGEEKGNVPYIGLVLADIGKQSRILNRVFTPVTHESLPFVAAPGQLSTCQIMKERISQKIIEKQDFCILGHNIAYSVSPQMHNAAFGVCQLPHEYGRMDVENVEEFIKSPLFNSPSFGGASVTIPHKQTIMPHLDEITPSATKIGAVNTIIVENNSNRVLIGDNTDWIGIYNPIKRLLRTSGEGYALILGAGGTARAAAYAAQELGLKCIFCNRTPEKAQELVDGFGGDLLPSDLASPESEAIVKDLVANNGDIKVVISTLPAAAGFEFPPWFVQCITSSVVVLDVNYKPYNTPLINQCLSNSDKFKVVRGSDMLWEQGVQQYERWMQRRAPYKVMRDVVLENCLPSPVLNEDEDEDES